MSGKRRPGNGWMALRQRESGVEQRRRSNRITPPLTQGSCLSEMLSGPAHTSPPSGLPERPSSNQTAVYVKSAA
ncbi:uncharacterized protein ACO6RY_13326 [Pungitius sinensis]